MTGGGSRVVYTPHDSIDASSPSSKTGRVIVLTGPPGAGKSTISSAVANELELCVHLHADDFWHCIKQGLIAPYLPEAHRQNTTVVGVLAQSAFGYAAGGYDVVCDGIIGPWFLGPFRAMSTTGGTELHYLVLRPDESTTLRRATSRTASDALIDPMPIRSLHRQFSNLNALEQHVLDTSHMTVATTANAVLGGIDSGRYRLS